MKKSVLITGANGFLGSSLVATLFSESGLKLVGLYRNKEDRLLRNAEETLAYVRCDLRDREAISSIFRTFQIEAVVHTAAAVSSRDDEDYLVEALRDNIQSQANLVCAALQHGCRRFIFCSTLSVYGSHLRRKTGFRENDPALPSSVYGWSKYSAEEILRVKAEASEVTQGVTLRFSGIHGPGRESGVVYNLLRSGLGGKVVTIRESRSRFRFLFVDDAVKAIRLALSGKLIEKYNCFNVAGGEIATLGELVRVVKRLPGNFCRVDIIEDSQERNQVLDIRKIRNELGFCPGTLAEKLKDFYDYLREASGG